MELDFAPAASKPTPQPRPYTPGCSDKQEYYVDLHIHVGQNGRGKPVKITASRRLTLPALIRHAWEHKGLDMIGVIDCVCTGVLQDLEKLIGEGELMELPEGGMRHRDRVTVIPGGEIEAVESQGGVSHHLCFFPFLHNLREFSKIMSRYITNLELSSQRASLSARELACVVADTGGVLVPAHAFTPHKSVYGNAGRRCREIFGERFAELPALELGLSSDSHLADRLEELQDLTFLSNSDAHSLEKIAREYNVMRMDKPNFRELMLALRRQDGRYVIANYGTDPRLGRYHRSFCLLCDKPRPLEGQAVLACPQCGAQLRKDFVVGVWDRISAIADHPETRPPAHRPPYRYQVPLSFLPGMGPQKLKQLVRAFGSEMAVLHRAPRSELVPLVGPALAQEILAARRGASHIESGAGGIHGKVHALQADHQLALF